MDAVRFESRKHVMAGDLVEQNDLGKSAISDGVQFNGDFDLPPEELAEDTSSCGVIIRRNRIFENAENAVDLKGTCRILVEDNLIYGNTGNNDGSVEINECSGELDDRCGGVAIMRGTGTSSRDNVIRRNVIFDNMSGIHSSDATWRVYNNTLVANNRDYTGPNSDFVTTDKPLFVGLAGGGMLKNNLIGNHRDAETYVHPGTDIDGNLYFSSIVEEPVFAVGVDPWTATSFEEWQAQGLDLGSAVIQFPFADATGQDFRLATGSEPVDRAIPLTTTVGAGSGTEVPVADAGYFVDGYGVTTGDRIVIGHGAPVTITAIDYDANVLTVDGSVTWEDGDGVQLEFAGSATDVGALELE
jgi:hypothetical protein